MSIISTTPAPDNGIALARNFLNRTDVIAVTSPWGLPCPGAVPRGKLADLISAHISGAVNALEVQLRTRRGPVPFIGPYRVGAYTPDRNGRTRWICLDVDGANHVAGSQTATALALDLVSDLTELGVEAHLERSGSEQGWHVWLFFHAPVPAGDARRFAHAIVRDRVVEIFPKSDRVQASGLGNFVWLPFWHAAPPGACQFFRLTPSGELEPYQPVELATNNRTILRRD